jgi:hypothetical protein
LLGLGMATTRHTPVWPLRSHGRAFLLYTALLGLRVLRLRLLPRILRHSTIYRSTLHASRMGFSFQVIPGVRHTNTHTHTGLSRLFDGDAINVLAPLRLVVSPLHILPLHSYIVMFSHCFIGFSDGTLSAWTPLRGLLQEAENHACYGCTLGG